MLIFLHFCSFFMSYDSGCISLCNIETIVFCCFFFGKIWFLTALFSWWFVYWVLSSTLEDALIANAIFNDFLKLKGYSAISVFLGNQLYIFLSEHDIFSSSTLWVFTSSPMDFAVSPMENLLLGLTSENVLKIWHFPRWVEQSPLAYWDKVFSLSSVSVISKITT